MEGAESPLHRERRILPVNVLELGHLPEGVPAPLGVPGRARQGECRLLDRAEEGHGTRLRDVVVRALRGKKPALVLGRDEHGNNRFGATSHRLDDDALPRSPVHPERRHV